MKIYYSGSKNIVGVHYQSALVNAVTMKIVSAGIRDCCYILLGLVSVAFTKSGCMRLSY